jgi:ribosome-associated toxin RatA of RatAB toxin-antitoxin module
MIFSKLFQTPVTKRHVQQNVIATHPLHLFRIIQDVDQYSTFLPLCHYSKIIHRSPDGRTFDGKLRIGQPPLFQEEYISRVTVIPEEWTIQAKSISSQNFDSLSSQWKLTELPTTHAFYPSSHSERTNETPPLHLSYQCHVDFFVEMTVSDPWIVSILDRILQQVASKQVEAFEKRCQALPIPHDLIEAAANYYHPRQ